MRGAAHPADRGRSGEAQARAQRPVVGALLAATPGDGRDGGIYSCSDVGASAAEAAAWSRQRRRVAVQQCRGEDEPQGARGGGVRAESLCPGDLDDDRASRGE